MSGIDPIQFGEMIQAIRSMKDRLAHLEEKVDHLTALSNRGKGVIGGLMLAAAGLGALLDNIWEFINR